MNNIENNVKITIVKKDDFLVDFLAELDFHNVPDIYTEIPIDESSRFISWDDYEDGEYNFYSTSLGCLLEKYKAVVISQI